MKSEIHSLCITFEDRIRIQSEFSSDKLLLSIASISGVQFRNIIGYRLYFNTEEDMVLFKLKYNL